jgi:hypothetical protein
VQTEGAAVVSDPAPSQCLSLERRLFFLSSLFLQSGEKKKGDPVPSVSAV